MKFVTNDKNLSTTAMLAFASTVVATQNTTTALQTIGLQQATSQRLEGRKTRANMTPEDMAKLKVQRLDKIVSLTDDQKSRVRKPFNRKRL